MAVGVCTPTPPRFVAGVGIFNGVGVYQGNGRRQAMGLVGGQGADGGYEAGAFACLGNHGVPGVFGPLIMLPPARGVPEGPCVWVPRVIGRRGLQRPHGMTVMVLVVRYGGK